MVRIDHIVTKILRKSDLARRIVGWSVELSKFGMRYEPHGSVRGQHLVKFVAELPIEVRDNPVVWTLFVDSSATKNGGGARIVLEGSGGMVIEQALIFRFKTSNNQVEYEALIAGMELALDLGVDSLNCQTNFQPVEGRVNKSFQVKDD